MTSKVCRWGILGTATIARKNWHSIFNSANGTLVAVASRERSRAEKFIGECQAQVAFADPPKACTYEELLADPNVDAVYIPLPTGIRKEWVIKAAGAKKHVLCEKPCGSNAGEVAEMLEACRKNNVQFMDGVMFMHSRRLESLRASLDDGESVGQIKRIATQFSFRAPDEFVRDNIRASGKLEPLGCLGDLGWYNVRFILWALKYAVPESVRGRLLASSQREPDSLPVPMEFSGELYFAGGISASFYCSFLTENQQWANVSGTKGYAHLFDFVLPFFGSEAAFQVTNAVFQTDGTRFNMAEHTRRIAVREYSNNTSDSQETMLFRKFGSLVVEHRLDPLWGEIALKTQQVLDACLASARSDGKTVSL